jgi:hypothetical protein
MSHSLSDLPLWELILAVIVIPTAIAIGFQVLVRRWVGVDRLVLNNEVAGFIFAIIGVVYAVLLAFVVIAVWDKFSEGQTSVARESAAAAALFQYAEGAEPEAAKLHESLVGYLRLAIEKDWPAMAVSSEDTETTDALSALYRAAMALNRTGTRSTKPVSAPPVRQGRKMTSLRFSPGAAGRYSFIAADFHRLLLAGLPARLSPES